MITAYHDNEQVTMYGLSTDSKPTVGVANGSKYVEMDSGKEYYFNEAGGAWVEWAAGGASEDT